VPSKSNDSDREKYTSDDYQTYDCRRAVESQLAMRINLDPEAIRRSVEQHAAEPQISVREHIRRVCLSLGKSIDCRRAVYLDTRYWIFLRDVIRDEPQKQVHIALLDELEKQVTAGNLFCPISDATFLELLKQLALRADESRQRSSTD
jgi:hypothetical protein